jgi:hypothetical protein
MDQRPKRRYWSLRLMAIWTALVTALAVIAGVTASLKNIHEFVASVTGLFVGDQSPARLSIRDARGTKSEQEGWASGDKNNVQVAVLFVIDKSGGKEVKECLGQLLFTKAQFAFQSEKSKFNIERGDVQRQQKIEIKVPKDFFERQAKFRVTCPNIITPWADTPLEEIFVNPFPPL